MLKEPKKPTAKKKTGIHVTGLHGSETDYNTLAYRLRVTKDTLEKGGTFVDAAKKLGIPTGHLEASLRYHGINLSDIAKHYGFKLSGQESHNVEIVSKIISEELEKGRNFATAAERLGITRKSLLRYISEHKLSFTEKPKPKMTDADYEKLARYLKAVRNALARGDNWQDVAKELGTNPNALKGYLRFHGLDIAETSKFYGITAGRPLTRKKEIRQILEIRRLRDEEHLTYPEIAKQMGLGIATIFNRVAEEKKGISRLEILDATFERDLDENPNNITRIGLNIEEIIPESKKFSEFAKRNKMYTSEEFELLKSRIIKEYTKDQKRAIELINKEQRKIDLVLRMNSDRIKAYLSEISRKLKPEEFIELRQTLNFFASKGLKNIATRIMLEKYLELYGEATLRS